MGPAIPMPPVRQRPTATPAEIRAAAEAAARLQGAKRVEQEQAKQRAQQEAAAVLTRGLDADVSLDIPLRLG
jgi:type VI protein secretion system component VasA